MKGKLILRLDVAVRNRGYKPKQVTLGELD